MMTSAGFRRGFCFSLMLVAAAAQQRPEPAGYSPIALAVAGESEKIYIIDDSGWRVIELDRSANKVVREITLPGRPTGAAAGPNGHRLYVTSDVPRAKTFVVDLERGTVHSALPAPAGATSPAISADGAVLYVAGRFARSISALNLADGAEARIGVDRDPRVTALTPDGSLLLVGHGLPEGPATQPEIASGVTLIDTRHARVAGRIHLPNGGVNIRGLAVSAGGRYAFVSHILARNRAPATQLEEGWLTTNAITVIDLQQRRRLNTLLLDRPRRGAGNPWGVALSADESRLFVSLAGVHELAVIGLPDLLETLKRLGPDRPPPAGAKPGYGSSPSTDLTFMGDRLQRVSLSGKGPRPLLIDKGRLYVGSYFGGALEVISLDGPIEKSQLVKLGGTAPKSLARRGEELFHDASLSFQGWQSCSTCHPGGRSDGLNWDLTNDGIGNTKNTRSLLFADRTPPSTMTGLFESLEVCVAFEIRTILFASRPKADADAIVAYLSSLQPIPSPHLVQGKLSASARRGKRVAEKAGCPECHDGDYFTIQKKRAVGTYAEGDHNRRFDVPTLREVWRTAPYLHDGRAPTVKSVFAEFDPDGLHGDHEQLSEKELDDLINYVLSL